MFGRLSKIERAYRRYPSAPLFARLADAWLEQGDTERALAVCLEGCERFPDYPTGFCLLSQCHQARGELEEARAALGKSLLLDAENPRGFMRLAQVYASLGIPTLALKCMEEAAHLDPFDESIERQLQQLGAQEPGLTDAADLVEFETTATDETPPVVTAAAVSDEVARSEDADAVAEDGPPAEHAEAESAGVEDPEPEQFPEAETVAPEAARAEPEPEEPEPTPPEPAAPEPAAPSKVDEPFGELRDMPEWEAAAPGQQLPDPGVGDDAARPPPAEADTDRQETAPTWDPEPDASDELAALGAEFFGEELSAEELPAGAEPETAAPISASQLRGARPTDSLGPVSIDRGADGDHVMELEALAKLRQDPMPTPTPAVESDGAGTAAPTEREVANTAAGAPPVAERTGGAAPDRSVSRFPRREDTDMAALLQEIDGQTEGDRGPDSESPGPIPTATLAELYERQGFVERAIEIYRQVLMAQPDNEEARTRLTALEAGG